jgi:hypothetical protein
LQKKVREIALAFSSVSSFLLLFSLLASIPPGRFFPRTSFTQGPFTTERRQYFVPAASLTQDIAVY